MAYETPPTDWEPGDVYTAQAANQHTGHNVMALTPSGVTYGIDGGGAVITTGFKTYIEVPFKCDLKRIRLLGNGTGSIEVDIRKCTYADFDGGSTHPVAGDTIFSGDKPAISSGTKYEDTTLTGVTTAWSEGDILEVQVVSVTTFGFVALALKVQRS